MTAGDHHRLLALRGNDATSERDTASTTPAGVKHRGPSHQIKARLGEVLHMNSGLGLLVGRHVELQPTLDHQLPDYVRQLPIPDDVIKAS